MCTSHINACAAFHGQSANWYNAAFAELAHQGKQEVALELLAEMQRAAVEPNEVTYRLFLTLGDVVASRNRLPLSSKSEKDKHWWLPPSPSPFAASSPSSSLPLTSTSASAPVTASATPPPSHSPSSSSAQSSLPAAGDLAVS